MSNSWLSRFARREWLMWWAFSAVVQALWSRTIRVPIDWDPAYYLDVSQNIVSGRGAVSSVIWHLSGPATDLPVVADLHWMPLPSRILVPAMWVWGDLGAVLMAVLVGAAWAPLSWALARDLSMGAQERSAAPRLAALCALFAGGYARFLSTPDSMALFGLVGAGALWAASRGWIGRTALLLVAAALTRGDGFLLAPVAAMVWGASVAQRRWRVVFGLSVVGPLATASWWLRSWLAAGPSFSIARAASSNALHIHSFLLGTTNTPTFCERFVSAVSLLGESSKLALVVGVGIIPAIAVGGAVLRRSHPLVYGWLAYAFLMPLTTGFFAPGIAASGTPFRSGAVLFVLATALTGVALVALDGWAQRVRGYPRGFVSGIVTVGISVGSLGMGYQLVSLRPSPALPCEPDMGEGPMFSGNPLVLRATCGVPGVALFRGESADVVAARAARLGVQRAYLPPNADDPLCPTADDAASLLPGWIQVSSRIWAAPSTTTAQREW